MTDSGGYRFSWWERTGDPEQQLQPSGPGNWVAVSGGGLPCEILLRIQRHADGRYAFSGLSIADDLPQPVEVTTQILRKIKLGEIQAALFGDGSGDFDPRVPGSGDSPTPGAVRWLADQMAGTGHVADGPSRGPRDDALRAFAATYREELARQPQRAMTAAARAHSISRATANRWAATCREYGYLPPVTSKERES